MVASQLLEPLVPSYLFFTFILVFKILQVLLNHIFRDFEALRDFYPIWQPKIVGELDALGQFHTFWQLAGLGWLVHEQYQ